MKVNQGDLLAHVHDHPGFATALRRRAVSPMRHIPTAAVRGIRAEKAGRLLQQLLQSLIIAE